MWTKPLAACLVATAVAAAPAVLAQAPPSGATDRPTATGTGATTSGSNAMQPSPSGGASGTAAPSTGAASSPAPSAAPPAGTASSAPPAAPMPGQSQPAGTFVTQLQDGQVMASRLMGTTVVSTNNESIGDVNDVILDRQGRIAGVVIGVGGFLGIGEKDVAVALEALEFTAVRQGGGSSPATAPASSRISTTGATGSNPANDQQATASSRQTATTGNTGNAGAGGAAQANSNNDGGVPDRIVLRMTKADLQSAPAFRTSRAPASGSTQKP